MRRRRFLTYSLYFLFALFILLAFIISRKIVENRDENVPWREDFTILKSGEEISALYYDGEKCMGRCNDGVYVYNAGYKRRNKILWRTESYLFCRNNKKVLMEPCGSDMKMA